MTCTNCQATIADKAIVCYRCGTATAMPAAPVRTNRPSRPWGMVVIAVILAAVLAWLVASFV